MTSYDWQVLYAKQCGYAYMWVSCQEPDPRNKTSHSHYKILSQWTETYWRWLSMTDSYTVQSSVAKTTRGPHVKSRTLEIKPRVHTIKFYWNWPKFVGDDSVWLIATVQSRVARPTRGPHVKSWTLKLKSRIRTIKFNRNWLKFFEMTQYNRQLLCAKQCG